MTLLLLVFVFKLKEVLLLSSKDNAFISFRDDKYMAIGRDYFVLGFRP